MTADRPVVVASIHDVTPFHRNAVEQLWLACRGAGLTPALLVVPNWHGHSLLANTPEFVAWLHRCVGDGAEILLHGERHDEVGLPRTVTDHLRSVGRTNGEGEFLTLTGAAARIRIERGLDALRACGLEPQGFVPPAWLTRPSTHAVVRALGLRVSEDVAHIYLHDRSGTRVVPTPAVRWSGRSVLRAHVSHWVTHWHLDRASQYARRQHPVRLALHPQDLQHAVTARSVFASIARWAAIGDARPYARLQSALPSAPMVVGADAPAGA